MISKVDLKTEQFCGNCHPLPAPSSFPKKSWPDEVDRGFKFYFESGRTDLDEPLVKDVMQYFQSRAPEKIELPSAESFPKFNSSVQFLPSPLLLSGDTISLTADIKWSQSNKSLWFSDMATGKLRKLAQPQLLELASSNAEVPSLTLPSQCQIAASNHLCRLTECDWNRDNIPDLLVAEIGSMIISDQKLGTVSIFLGQPDGSLQRIPLATELARPVEAVPFDYDDDGDLDIVIAEFGYNLVGCLSLLRNQKGNSDGIVAATDFVYEVLDSRHGHVAVTLADINADGKLDLVTAIGQEYESVQIRYNLGQGKFKSEIVMALPDPSYNTSEIQVVDVDNDGRLDILHTCGDIFDSFVPKPFHGVRWIRNLGEGRWETRELGMLIGAMQAMAADFDSDGDMDIVAVGLFPAHAKFTSDISFDSICWWEQKEDLQFVRHSIERDRCLHSSCTVADVDDDGRIDLIVGEWAQGNTPASIRVFWNRAAK